MAQGKITAKQQEILSFIKERILEKGYPPAVREICEAVHLKSTSSVHSHLETLEKNGFIRRDPTKPRAIEICDDSFQAVRSEMVSLPVVGNVAAGQPILAEENIESYFPVPSEYVPNGEPSFILKVRGDSMVNAGIRNGDQIFVQSCSNARNGDIVVALDENNENTLKIYGGIDKKSSKVILKCANEKVYPGKVILVNELVIQGVAKHVIKEL